MVQVSNAPEVLLGVHVTTNCCGGGVKIEDISACMVQESSNKVAESTDVSFLAFS